MADKVGGVYIEIQARMGSLEKDLRTLQTRMQQVDNSGSQLSGTMSKFGAYLTGGAIAAGIFQIGKSALSASAAMEQNRVAFTTMLGSAEKAKTLLAEMQTFAESTPFEFTEIAEAGKKMIAFGFSSGEVVEKLRALGDVSAGLGVPLNDMAYLFGQIKTQGRAMTQDLNQFAARGIPIYEELGKVLGMDAENVKDFASTGKIAFKDIDQVFKNLTKEGGKFAGLMDAQSKTLAGRWSNFNDQLNKSLVILGDQMAPTAGSILSIFTKLLENDNLRSEKAKEAYDVEIKRLQAQGEYGEAYLRQNGYIATFLNMLDGTMEKEIELAKFKNQQVTSEFEQRQSFQERDRALMEKNGDAEKKQIVSTVKAGKDKWKALKDEAKKYYDAVRGIATGTDDPVKQVENEIAALDVGMTRTEWLYEKGKISKQQYENTLASYTEARIKKEEELEQAKFDRMREYYNLGVSTLTGFSGQINELASMYASNQTTRIEQEAQKRTDALNAEYENQVAIIDASAASDSQKAEQKKALDEQLARDTKAINDKAEKEKRKIARDAAKIQKELAIFETIIATPQAAFQAYKSAMVLPFPASQIVGAAMAAATTGLGIAKLKLIQDQPLPALAEGGIVPAIPGGRQITVAEGGNSEGVIPFNAQGVDILAQAMEKAIGKIGGTGGVTNVYIDSELIYSNMYEASRRGAVKIDQRAIV